MHRVTIVIGAYGKPLELQKTLKSLVGQLDNGLHVLIIDDNCPSNKIVVDETAKVVNNFSTKLDITFIKNKTRVGVPYVFKKWINSVAAEFIMLYGDGDIMLPGSLIKLLECLDNNPQAALAHGFEAPSIDSIPNASGKVTLIDSKEYLKTNLIGGAYQWSQMSCLIRTEALKLKTEVVKDWYWDHYFHCQIHLFSDQICSLDESVVIRGSNEVAQKAPLDNNKIFRHHSERKLQSLDFMNKYERVLLYKKIPINYYRLIIVSNLIVEFFFITSVSKKMLILRKVSGELLGMFSSFLISLLSYPFTLLATIFLKIINKALNKK
ncbi:glycosyltransferase [Gammaproteobacteria bacterium]|nr:glycosyltransferase [Gammaproteobacteria bacterium]MDC0090019.1 glycosyltransferase [Gammaproteobacteria bacterium]